MYNRYMFMYCIFTCVSFIVFIQIRVFLFTESTLHFDQFLSHIHGNRCCEGTHVCMYGTCKPLLAIPDVHKNVWIVNNAACTYAHMCMNTHSVGSVNLV